MLRILKDPPEAAAVLPPALLKLLVLVLLPLPPVLLPLKPR